MLINKASSDLEALVDEYGQLIEELAPVRPKLRRVDQIRQTIQASFDDKAADQEFELRGKAFKVDVSACGVEKILDKVALYAHLGKRRFLALCGFTLKAAGSVLCGDELERFITEEQTGSRRLTPTRL